MNQQTKTINTDQLPKNEEELNKVFDKLYYDGDVIGMYKALCLFSIYVDDKIDDAKKDEYKHVLESIEKCMEDLNKAEKRLHYIDDMNTAIKAAFNNQ